MPGTDTPRLFQGAFRQLNNILWWFLLICTWQEVITYQLTGIKILRNSACLCVLFSGYMFCSQCFSYLIIFMMIKVLKGLNFPCEYFVNLQPDIHQFRISKGARGFLYRWSDMSKFLRIIKIMLLLLTLHQIYGVLKM